MMLWAQATVETGRLYHYLDDRGICDRCASNHHPLHRIPQTDSAPPREADTRQRSCRVMPYVDDPITGHRGE